MKGRRSCWSSYICLWCNSFNLIDAYNFSIIKQVIVNIRYQYQCTIKFRFNRPIWITFWDQYIFKGPLPKNDLNIIMHSEKCVVKREMDMQLLTPWMTTAERNEKRSNGVRISSPGAKPFPQKAAWWLRPYLRRAARGEALIGDWGGWRLIGWWASLIAVLLEGRALGSTEPHDSHRNLMGRDLRWD